MSCPPHFRRSATSPVLPISHAPPGRTPLGLVGDSERPAVGPTTRARAAPAGAFTRDWDAGNLSDERGRGVRRTPREGRRSVTTGALVQSASRARGATTPAVGWVEAPDTLGAGRGARAAGALETQEQAGEERPGLERLGGGQDTPDDLASDEELAAWVAQGVELSVPPASRPSPTPSLPEWRAVTSATRSHVLVVVPKPARRPAPISLPTASSTYSPLNPRTTDPEIDVDSELSPLFSPEHATFVHIALNGAGGPRRCPPSSSFSFPHVPAPRVTYDVPSEFDAWEAASRFVEAASGGDGVKVAKGRADDARRRLEMVRLQLDGA